MYPPAEVWWRPIDRLERSWVIIAFVWALVLTAMMPLWFVVGKQNVPVTTYRTTPERFRETVEAFAAEHQVGERAGIPVVAPPPGGDAYVYAQRFSFYPILQLEKGEEYRIHVSSLDVQHGFSIQPVNLNFQIVPTYEYVITLTPTESGEFQVVCNEYCGLGHHVMTGTILVNE
ncbi:MAG TPA: cytochrome C oxidase subunit II [Actinobacteria bacterium]|nr:cytochrome C oxidase subunit II [Actinomycetota bacterium]